MTNDGELDAAVQLLHPGIEWLIAREHPDTKTLTGREAVAEYQRDWQDLLPDVRFELEGLLDAGSTVVGIGMVRGTAAGSGAGVRVPLAFLFVLKDGLIARVEEYLNPAEAVEAAGLPG